ncbi:MAG: hypothetical protein Q9M13_06985, partial [Mariprofundales bacterium]|nr:hypothetical protein [Mariprofundales bacterium]
VPVDETICLHGVNIAKARLPIRPGRSMAILVEVATRNQLLKLSGIDSNQQFAKQLHDRINNSGDKST